MHRGDSVPMDPGVCPQYPAEAVNIVYAAICVCIPGWETQVRLCATVFKDVSSPLGPMDSPDDPCPLVL